MGVPRPPTQITTKDQPPAFPSAKVRCMGGPFPRSTYHKDRSTLCVSFCKGDLCGRAPPAHINHKKTDPLRLPLQKRLLCRWTLPPPTHITKKDQPSASPSAKKICVGRALSPSTHHKERPTLCVSLCEKNCVGGPFPPPHITKKDQPSASPSAKVICVGGHRPPTQITKKTDPLRPL